MNYASKPFAYTPSPPHPGSILIQLCLLPHLAPGTRVRFIGCVTNYDIPTSTLTLTSASDPAPPSAYCAGSRAPPTLKAVRCNTSTTTTNTTTITALVDVEHPLSNSESLPHEHAHEFLVSGAWVSVVGYIAYPTPGESIVKKRILRAGTAKEERVDCERDGAVVKVQALLLARADEGGIVSMERFGRVVEGRRQVMGMMRRAREGWVGE